MVAGDRSHYRTGEVLAHRSRGATCPDPGCDCGGWVPTPGLTTAPGGDPAHPWFAAYVTGYTLAGTPDAGHPGGVRVTGGVCRVQQVLRVRQVSETGRAMSPWRTVEDWAERYQAPLLAAGPAVVDGRTL